jgi:hypothetical protein
VEDRILEPEDKIEIKEKTEELLVKQLKTCKKNIQNSPTLSKDQTSEPPALKKRSKQKELIS